MAAIVFAPHRQRLVKKSSHAQQSGPKRSPHRTAPDGQIPSWRLGTDRQHAQASNQQPVDRRIHFIQSQVVSTPPPNQSPSAESRPNNGIHQGAPLYDLQECQPRGLESFGFWETECAQESMNFVTAVTVVPADSRNISNFSFGGPAADGFRSDVEKRGDVPRGQKIIAAVGVAAYTCTVCARQHLRRTLRRGRRGSLLYSLLVTRSSGRPRGTDCVVAGFVGMVMCAHCDFRCFSRTDGSSPAPTRRKN